MNMWPFSRLKNQANEIKRLQDVITKQLTGDITLSDLRGSDKGVGMSLTGSAMHIFAEAFGEQFFESKAENFLTVSFKHADSGELFEVTMQKVSGETVGAQLTRLRNEIYQLRNQGVV